MRIKNEFHLSNVKQFLTTLIHNLVDTNILKNNCAMHLNDVKKKIHKMIKNTGRNPMRSIAQNQN